MFYRHKFVTNSSSSSFIAFGVSIDNGFMEDLCDYFLGRYPEESENQVRSWYEDEETIAKFKANPIEFLQENDRDFEFVEAMLPEDVWRENPPDADFFYLSIGYPDVIIDADGNTRIRDRRALQSGYLKLREILDGIKSEETIREIQDSWYS
jgi:hypothetical protein